MAKPNRESPPTIQTSATPLPSSTPETPSTPEPPPRAQEALYHGAGRFRELLLFRPTAGAAHATVIDKTAQLLKSIEMGLQGKPLKILVAVAASYLDQLPRPEFRAEVVNLPDDKLAVLVQVAAETEDERTYARRMVKRIFGRELRLAFEYCGGLHLLNREPFGFPDSTPTGQPEIPLSAAEDADGATWLYYQHYRQDVEGFFKLQPEEQIAIMGRPREPVPSDQLKAMAVTSSHLQVSRNGAEPGRTPLLRRSISYERYDEAGLNFLAIAKHPKKLQEALQRFEQGDGLRKHVEPKEGGLFFVPPGASWLKANTVAPSPLANAPEAPFTPRFPLVLYELTPKANEFFHRVFHVNNRNLDEDVSEATSAGSRKTLRADIKLLSRGLTKLIFGGRIAPNTQIYRFLDLVLHADVTNGLDAAASGWAAELAELRQAVADHEKGKLERALPEESRTTKPLSDLRGALNQKREKLFERVSEDPALLSILSRERLPETLAPLLAEVVVSDAETMSELTAATKIEIDEIAKLCEEAGDEARALNEFVGEYMTFPC